MGVETAALTREAHWQAHGRAGFRCIPVMARDKKPAVEWKAYQSKAPSADEIDRWARGNYNIGIVTGAASGIIVLDLDTPAAVEEAKRRILPDTATARTAHGRHIYFKHPGGTIGNRAGIFPGADIRGDGGYVVGVGSVHPDGAEYEWLRSPEEVGFALPPLWLMDLLAKPEPSSKPTIDREPCRDRYAKAAMDGEIGRLVQAGEGQRNDQLNKAAFALAQLSDAGGISETSAKAQLEATARSIGLDADEIAATIESGWTAGLASPRSIPDRRIEQRSKPTTRAKEERRVSGSGLPVEFWDEIKASLECNWLVDGLLASSTMAIVFGHPGSGKTFAALGMALAVASGQEWLDKPVQQGGVVYIAAEGQSGLRRRKAAWEEHFAPQGEVKFALIPTAIDLLNPNEELTELHDVLERCAERFDGLALIVVDTLSATFGGGDENGSDMAAYVANISRLAAPFDCTRMIVHHQPLNAEAKRPRGHGSLWGAADTAIHVQGDSEAPARRLHVIKQKDAGTGPDTLFKLKPIVIGFDEDGTEVTSCIVEPADPNTTGRSRFGMKYSHRDQIAMEQLKRVLGENGRNVPDEIPKSVIDRAKTVRVADLSEWRSAAMSALTSPDTKPDSARRSFDRIRDKLQAAEVLGMWEDWVWFVN